MTLYTPLPLEIVLEQQEMPKERKRIITMNNVNLEVEDLPNGQVKIQRVLSSNPQDFLRIEMQPGVILKYSLYCK